MFELEFHPKVDRNDLKRIDRELLREIRGIHVNKIIENPFEIEPLRGKWGNVRSYHFSYKGTEYRILYQIAKKPKKIYIILNPERILMNALLIKIFLSQNVAAELVSALNQL